MLDMEDIVTLTVDLYEMSFYEMKKRITNMQIFRQPSCLIRNLGRAVFVRRTSVV